jgi:two-component system LytT family response regulator
MVKLGKTFYLVDIDTINWIESERNYIRIHLEDKSYLLRKTLSLMERMLDSRMFVRINRSTIVNINRIKELRSHNKSDYLVILDNNKSWIWGRRFRDNIRKVLN